MHAIPSRVAILLATLAASPALGEGAAGYYRQPEVGADTIVFVAEGDLWTIPIETALTGGLADRLTSHPGDETHPALSPDGTRVAFVATYEGPPEVYVMDVRGGLPTRATFDGSAIETVRWLDDHRVLFSSRGRSTLPNVQLFALDVADPARPSVEPVPLWQAADGVFTPQGQLIFTRQAFQGSHAKRYKGGTAQQLWRWDGGEQEARGLTTDFDGTSRQPMWWNGRAYFVSDRDGTMNIWSMNAEGGDLRQHTRHDGWDVLGPALHEVGAGTGAAAGTGARIVYQLGADLRMLELPTDADRPLDIRLRSDLDQLREQWIAKPGEYITSAHVSPDGKRVAITARGRIFVAPAKPGRLVEVDRDSTVRWRDARFVPAPEKPAEKTPEKAPDKSTGTDGAASPATPDAPKEGTGPAADAPSQPKAPTSDGAPADDSKPEAGPPDPGSLIALSDRSGEVEIWTLPANGVFLPPNEPRQRTTDGSVLRWFAVPSPDGTLVAHTDKNQRLWLLNLVTNENRQVTQSMIGDVEDVAWAPDSKWFTFTMPAGNMFRQVILCRADDLSMTPLTSDRFDSYSAWWTPDGKWIYFLSDRNLETVVDSPWGPYQPEPFMARTGRIYALSLKAGERFPFLSPDELQPAKAAGESKGGATVDAFDPPRFGGQAGADILLGDDNAAPAGGAAPEANAGKSESKPKAPAGPKPVEIDLAGIAERLHEVPAPAGRFANLTTNGKVLFWQAIDPITTTRTLSALEIGNEEVKVVAVAEKIARYEMSQDGSTLLVQREGGVLSLVPAKAAAADLGKTGVDLSGWALSLVPRDQWRQMFTDAWRLHRDYFYDPSMHGVDWKAMREKYAPLVDRVTTRAELSDVLAQMVSELSALHTSVRGGDLRRGPDQIRTASLGAELVRDEAARGWRVARIYATDPDDPAAAGPLARPESRVAVGEVIELINGTPTLSVPDPAVLLRGTAGRQVLLHVRGPAGTDGEAPLRPVIVKPVSTADAAGLRYDDWTLSRRREVERLGEGRIGYVHLRAMGEENWVEWARSFFPVFNRDALIIDVRHNRGGNIDSWILNRLLRRAWFGWSSRVGQQPLWNMQYAFRGHIAVLTDEWTASDGEAFAEGIKRLDIGEVIGTRTWGGEIWLSGSNLLIDRGVATAAEFGVYGPDGIWLIEGRGVEPDLVVDNLPRETFAGKDRQLETAVDFLKRRLAEKPIPPLTRPAYPDKSR